MEFGYCFGCGIRVSTAELKAGSGRRFQKGLCCQACAILLERTLAAARESVEKLALGSEASGPKAPEDPPLFLRDP